MIGSGRRARAAALALAAAAALACAPRERRPPDVVLIVVDTLRADRVSSYGYARATTPRLDALAARGIRFADASSSSSWTVPAHASLFTGLHPIDHGATQEHPRLGEEPATLAELLAARGYATLGASANPLVSQRTGLTRGFERFLDTWRGRRRRDSGQHPNRAAVEALFADLFGNRPFFLFVNYIEPHAPYRPPEPYRSRWLPGTARPDALAAAQRISAESFYLGGDAADADSLALLSDLYDGEVSRADALVGELLDFLAESGRLERALLIVTSDHGENLGDHGHFRHLFSLYRSTVHVPLIAVLPDGARAGEVVRTPVGLVDLFAAIAARAGAALPPGARGRDLLSGALEPAPVFAEYYTPLQALEVFPAGALAGGGGALARYLRRLRSVQQGPLRLLRGSDGRVELFDLARDPGERSDLAEDPAHAGPARELAARLDGFVAAAGGEPPFPEPGDAGGGFGELDEEMAEQLRELGYLR